MKDNIEREKTHSTSTTRHNGTTIKNEKRIPEKDVMNCEDEEGSEIKKTQRKKRTCV